MSTIPTNRAVKSTGNRANLINHASEETAMRAQLSTLTRRAAVATALIGALAVAACNQAGGKAEGDMAIGAGEDAGVSAGPSFP